MAFDGLAYIENSTQAGLRSYVKRDAWTENNSLLKFLKMTGNTITEKTRAWRATYISSVKSGTFNAADRVYERTEDAPFLTMQYYPVKYNNDMRVSGWDHLLNTGNTLDEVLKAPDLAMQSANTLWNQNKERYMAYQTQGEIDINDGLINGAELTLAQPGYPTAHLNGLRDLVDNSKTIGGLSRDAAKWGLQRWDGLTAGTRQPRGQSYYDAATGDIDIRDPENKLRRLLRAMNHNANQLAKDKVTTMRIVCFTSDAVRSKFIASFDPQVERNLNSQGAVDTDVTGVKRAVTWFEYGMDMYVDSAIEDNEAFFFIVGCVKLCQLTNDWTLTRKLKHSDSSDTLIQPFEKVVQLWLDDPNGVGYLGGIGNVTRGA